MPEMEQGEQIVKNTKKEFEKPAGRYVLEKPSEGPIRGPESQKRIINEIENNKKLLEELSICLVSSQEGAKERAVELFQELIKSEEYRVDFVRKAGKHLGEMSEDAEKIKGINDQPKKEQGLIKSVLDRIKKM